MFNTRNYLVLLVAIATSWPQVVNGDETADPRLRPLVQFFAENVRDKQIVGAQFVIGDKEQILTEQLFGKVAVDSDAAVDSETLFCIGSCSKPFAAACVMSLVEEETLQLDEPIDGYLPQFAEPTITNVGKAKRAPTLRELLCHRGGIYSQKVAITPQQARYIRDFKLTLTESVNAIAGEELLAEPGTEFAYSGAGYCVLGCVAEEVCMRSFEDLLRARVTGPLGMQRTTYFPSPEDTNVAAGARSSDDGLVTNKETPHLLGRLLKFPLIGGSLYSTALESARFAQMHLGHGSADPQDVLTESSWVEATDNHFEGQPYGMGWSLTLKEGDSRPTRLIHNGALASSRGMIIVDLAREKFFVGYWTVASPGKGVDSQELRAVLNKTVQQTLSRVSH